MSCIYLCASILHILSTYSIHTQMYVITDVCHSQAPFNVEKFKEIVNTSSKVTDQKTTFKKYGPCAGNVLWINILRPVVTGVPINVTNIHKLMEDQFDTPDSAKADQSEVKVGLLEADCAAFPGDNSRLKLLSAEEVLHALVLRVHDRLEEGPVTEINQWKEVLLTWPMSFEIHQSDDAMYWRSINVREAIGTQFDILYRSSIQRCFELIAWKNAQEAKRAGGSRTKAGRMDSKTLFEAWNSQVKFATLIRDDGTENAHDRAFKQSFVDASLTCYNRLLIWDDCRKLVLEAEDRISFPSCGQNIMYT